MAVPESFEVSPVLKRLEREAWCALRDRVRASVAIADRIRKDDGPWDGTVPIKTRKEAAGMWLLYRVEEREAGVSCTVLAGVYETFVAATAAARWRAGGLVDMVRVDSSSKPSEWRGKTPAGMSVTYRVEWSPTTFPRAGSPWVPATHTPKKPSSYFEISAGGGIRVGRQR
jgi:hypothetical protein